MKNNEQIHPRGAISLGCLGYIIVIACFWAGGQGVFTWIKNREPLEITIEDYIGKKPDALWLTLKNARLSLLEAAHKESISGRITEIYIPLRRKDEQPGAPVHVLLSTKDKEIIAALDDINSGKDMKQVVDAASRHAEKLFMEKDITGLVRYGIHSDDKTRDKLAGLRMRLAKGFVIVDEGEKPDLLTSVLMLVFGAAVAIGMLRSAAKEAGAPSPLPPPNLPPKL